MMIRSIRGLLSNSNVLRSRSIISPNYSNLHTITNNKFVELRKELNKMGEVSSMEKNTRSRIKEFLTESNSECRIEEIEGSLISTYTNTKMETKIETQTQPPCIAFRCELDAVQLGSGPPVHACGHDGYIYIYIYIYIYRHMATMTAFAAEIGPTLQLPDCPPHQISLIFQSGEETGEGGRALASSPQFASSVHPEYIFALHNLPGYPLGSVVVRGGVVTSGSKGVVIQLEGREAHAAFPALGVNPAHALRELLGVFMGINDACGGDRYDSFVQSTIVHVCVGEAGSFGVAPGRGVLMATLRVSLRSDMARLDNYILDALNSICKEHSLTYTITEKDSFIPTVNSHSATQFVISSARNLPQTQFVELDQAFRFSEDFAWFGETGAQIAFFALGAGDVSNLHSPEYDYPDQLIDIGKNIYLDIYKQWLETIRV